jgi:aconitate hydratase
MGVAPFTFQEGTSWQTLGLVGDERVTIRGLANVKPRAVITLTITRADGSLTEVPVLCRIDTLDEIEYFRNGGILHYVLRNLAA